MRRGALAAAALALFCGAAAAEGERVLSVAEYREALQAIEAALTAGDAATAAAVGQDLKDARVAFGGEEVAVDPVVIAAVSDAATGGQSARVRVRAVLRGLEASETPAAAPDAELLRRAQRAEARSELPAGGQVAGMPVKPSVPRRFLDAIASAWRALGDAWDRFVRWLKKFWPRRAIAAPGDAGMGTSWMVVALVIAVAVVIALLAVSALRRSQGKADAPASQPRPESQRDADPLSREQEEWEAYASELAAAGRTREAIRAWYHAVLVALFRAGFLHHHKGRTNWEYVSRVSPDSAWRPELIGLTRRFDREWYGSERSAADSLRECAAEARSILRQVRTGVAA